MAEYSTGSPVLTKRYALKSLQAYGSPKRTIFPLQVGFEASNLTQVPLQPSCPHSRLKPHPLSNELAIVMALGQWLPLQSEKIASLPEKEALRTWPEDHFLSPFVHRRREMAHPGLIKGFLQLSPEAAMLPWPRVEIHPPPLSHLFYWRIT